MYRSDVFDEDCTSSSNFYIKEWAHPGCGTGGEAGDVSIISIQFSFEIKLLTEPK